MSTASASNQPAWFPPTAWTCIQKAGDPDHPDHLPALNRFARAYWKPVFRFLRRHGHPPDRAEELTQAFFLRFLERGWIQSADQERGKFRTFLLTLLKRFLSDEGPQRASEQQLFERRILSLDGLMSEEERAWEPAVDDTPEAVLTREWLIAVVDNVLNNLRQLCDTPERQAGYEALLARQFAQRSREHLSQEALADKYKLTREQVRHAEEQVRERFKRLLKAEVREQVGSEAEVKEEIREILALYPQ